MGNMRITVIGDVTLFQRYTEDKGRKFLSNFCSIQPDNMVSHSIKLHKSAEKPMAFPIYSTTKRIFLGCVKEVRTTKS
jgi:hypothetical protein